MYAEDFMYADSQFIRDEVCSKSYYLSCCVCVGTQPAIRFFHSINFLHRDLQTFPVKLESRFCCGNLHTIISH